MADSALFAQLESLLTSRGLTFLACADLTALDSSVRHDLPVGICLGVGLDPVVVSQIADGPTREYAAQYKHVNLTSSLRCARNFYMTTAVVEFRARRPDISRTAPTSPPPFLTKR